MKREEEQEDMMFLFVLRVKMWNLQEESLSKA